MKKAAGDETTVPRRLHSEYTHTHTQPCTSMWGQSLTWLSLAPNSNHQYNPNPNINLILTDILTLKTTLQSCRTSQNVLTLVGKYVFGPLYSNEYKNTHTHRHTGKHRGTCTHTETTPLLTLSQAWMSSCQDPGPSLSPVIQLYDSHHKLGCVCSSMITRVLRANCLMTVKYLLCKYVYSFGGLGHDCSSKICQPPVRKASSDAAFTDSCSSRYPLLLYGNESSVTVLCVRLMQMLQCCIYKLQVAGTFGYSLRKHISRRMAERKHITPRRTGRLYCMRPDLPAKANKRRQHSVLSLSLILTTERYLPTSSTRVEFAVTSEDACQYTKAVHKQMLSSHFMCWW